MSDQLRTLRQPFTAEEQRQYDSLFRELDKDGTGVVVGEDARATFEKSGLAPMILGEIWQLADPTNLGYLTQFGFNVALRLIGHVQSGAKPDRALIDIAGPLAKFQPPQQQQAQFPQQTSQQGVNGLPPLTNHDISKFVQLFARNAPSGVISGDQARGIFLKAKLPTNVLGQIWALADRTNRGQLTRDEFVIAMYLIQGSIQGAIKQLPQSIPQSTWDQVKFFQSPAISGTGSPSLPQSQTFSPQTTGSQRPSVSRVPSSFANASSDWTITPQKKAQFDNIFEGLDKNSQGVLGPNDVAPFLMTSKLPQDVLATVWDLADIHNTGQFTKDEFAIAMFLVQKKIAGCELPEIIPDSLLPSTHPAVQQQQQQQQQQADKPIPRIPSRDTKPSALSDLVDLNDAFSSPSPAGTMDSRNVSNSTVNYTPIGTNSQRQFVPSSSFGQNLQAQNKEASPVTSSTSNAPVVAPIVAPVITSPVGSQVPASSTTQQAFGNVQQKSASTFEQPTQAAASASSGFVSAAGSGISGTAMLAGAGIAGAAGLAGAALSSGAGLFKSNNKNVNNDLLADSNPEISGQLSKATTDMANLSNQIGSLTTQTTQIHEKRTKAQNELARITALKTDIESKLARLRSAYEQEVAQTGQVETALTAAKQENEKLRQETSVAEAQFNQVHTQLQTLQAELEESHQSNESLKERLASLHAEQAEATQQLEKTQVELKQSKSLASINSEQVNVAQITSNGIKAEIAALLAAAAELETQHKSYSDKQLELDSLKKELDDKQQSFVEYQQQFDSEYQAKDQELQLRKQQQEQNEAAIQQEEERVQKLFVDLQQRQAQFQAAEEQLQQQQFEYAQRVQQFTEKQINDATTGFTSVAEDVVSPEGNSKQPSGNTAAIIGGAATGAVTAVALGAAAGSIGGDTQNDEANTQFSSPVGATTDQTRSVTSDQDVPYPSHLEIEKQESITSSVQNNAPHSVRGDDIEETAVTEPIKEEPALAENVLSKDYNSEQSGNVGTAADDPSSGAGSFEIVEAQKPANVDEEPALKGAYPLPGSLEGTSEVETITQNPADVTEPAKTVASTENTDFDDLVPAAEEEENEEAAQAAATEVAPKSTEEEFPPIKELEIDESDSEDEFHETSESLPQSTPANVAPVATSVTAVPAAPIAVPPAANDDFDFDDLEEAKEGDDEDLDDQHFDELEDSNFYRSDLAQGEVSDQQGTVPAQQGSQDNDEWEQIFAGFGNQPQQSAPTVVSPVPQASHISTNKTTQVHVPPRIATTPRSLAIQELTGMGFSKDEALAALEREKWNLEAATNYLLDNA